MPFIFALSPVNIIKIYTLLDKSFNSPLQFLQGDLTTENVEPLKAFFGD